MILSLLERLSLSRRSKYTLKYWHGVKKVYVLCREVVHISVGSYQCSFHVCRVKKENRLFAGMWYGSSKPDMSLFLKPLAETLTKLYKDGACT